MATPELRQFGELSLEDFHRHPVWIRCHTADYSQPWYDETDEETFRPWMSALPANVLRETLLISAVFELADGTQYPGFVTPLVEGWDTSPKGRASSKPRHALGRQQPQIFVGDRRFSFWGGVIGISKLEQRDFYAALRRTPEQIFPVQFRGRAGLANGVGFGHIDGFYKRTREGIVQVENTEFRPDPFDTLSEFFQMKGSVTSGYPQPESVPGYREAVYSEYCPRCGIYGPQKAPFRFKKSTRPPLSGFMQLGWVTDAFFVARKIASEITRAGITGISFGPAVEGRSGEELGDRVQMVIPTTLACAETSHLPPVTCRSNNEEVASIRAMIEKWHKERPSKTPSLLNPTLQERIRIEKEKLAAIPFCGKIKHHSPTSLAIIPNSTEGAPDLFQTAAWFGSGACAFRLTLASRRFVELVRDHGWKGLEFPGIRQNGFSERE